MYTNHSLVEATMLQDSCGCFTSSKASLYADQQSKPQPCSSLNIPLKNQYLTVSDAGRLLKGRGVIGTKEQTLGFTTVGVPGITTKREKIFLKIILFQIQVPKPFLESCLKRLQKYIKKEIIN